MLGASIRNHLRATPFKPFVIQMNDGRRFKVPHPEFAAISPAGTEDGGGLILSTLLVASIEPMRRATR
jgi:hypothetical protein